MNAVEDPPHSTRERAKHVGARIRARRRAIDMGQRALAGHLGIRQDHLSRWETGGREPGEAKLRQIADILGCSWLDFYMDQLDDNGELVT